MRLRLVACCGFLISIFAFPAAALAAADVWRLDVQLVTTSAGWATYNGRLLWTNNAGGSWKDITPPLDTQESISSVFFLRASVGWVTIFSEAAELESSLSLASTSDGGQTWHKSQVSAANRFLSLTPQIWAGNSYIFFLDSTNGWIELKRASGVNFKDGILLSTRDGGKNWSELPQPPTVDRMTWISPNVGWIAGGVLQGDLFATRDGGLTWQTQTPPVPSGTNDPLGHAAPPRFSDSEHGTFVVTFSGLKVDEAKSLVAVYRTSDSGKTWIRSDLQEVPSLSVSGWVADDATPIWAHFANGKVNTAEPSNINSAQVPSVSVPVDLDVIGSSFVDADTGFLIMHGQSCGVVKAFCPEIWQLLFTRDAGTSVLDVTPSEKANAAPSGATSSTGASPTPQLAIAPPGVISGFDINLAPALSQMATAKNNGYSVVGIYIGGANSKAQGART